MGIKKELFGRLNQKDVYIFTLDNHKGLCAEIITLGGIVRTLKYNGIDLVLGRDCLEEYTRNEGFFGALIGRNSNRIENSEFDINGVTYKLNANDGRNNLHGGNKGFDQKIWSHKVIEEEQPGLVLSLVSPDGDEGFPGEVKVEVTYTLTEDNSLKIEYNGISDADTVLNLTNHSYFNLNGHNSGNIENHTLTLNSSFFTPNTAECMPYGEILSVEDTPFDFRKGKKVGQDFDGHWEDINMFGGYDHNFVLDGKGFRFCGQLTGDKSGITMELYTDCPGVQLYTGNVIEQGRVCKDGAVYPIHGALCLETQVFPNGLKFPHYPNAFLKAGEKYHTVTQYKFK